MGKKRSWFSLVKRFFIAETKPKPEKKSNKWGWIFGRLNLNKCPALEASQVTLNEAMEEQRKQALVVAMATTAAAEAAIAAAHAAAEVVRLTSLPHESEMTNLELSAIKIQAAYRGHLARKALRALKGLVKLQAIVRGQIVRRRLVAKLEYFPSISKFQSLVQEFRVPMVDENCRRGENKQISRLDHNSNLNNSKFEGDSKRSWDDKKEDMETIWLRNQEHIRRDSMKKYSFSYRERKNYRSIEEDLTNKGENRRQNHVEDKIWADACKNLREKGRLKLNPDDRYELQNLKQRNLSNSFEDSSYSPILLPRRSFCHVKHKLVGDEADSLPTSPVFPSYMAATESAKAKARPMSTPKQRLGSTFDDCSTWNNSSPYKSTFTSWYSSSAVNCETNSHDRARFLRVYKDRC